MPIQLFFSREKSLAKRFLNGCQNYSPAAALQVGAWLRQITALLTTEAKVDVVREIF